MCRIEQCVDEKIRSLGLCSKHYYGKWNEENKYKRKVITKRYRENHKIECIERTRIWVDENPEYHKNYDKEYYKKNKETVKLRYNKWYKENPDKKFKLNLKNLEKISVLFNMNSKQYQYALISWSKTIKKLDNNMCKLCDSTENLNAHHLYPKKDFPYISLDLNNGITLCRKCHCAIHELDII